MTGLPEPWLRGPVEGVHPAAAHLVYTFAQVRDEVERFCKGLPPEAVWRAPGLGIAPLGFQLRHIVGSVDRLTTYLRGEQLTALQLAALKAETEAGATLDELHFAMEAQFARTEEFVRAIPPSSYEDARTVGRRKLPTTVIGLIIHISEHTQRHLGQAILTAKLVSS